MFYDVLVRAPTKTYEQVIGSSGRLLARQIGWVLFVFGPAGRWLVFGPGFMSNVIGFDRDVNGPATPLEPNTNVFYDVLARASNNHVKRSLVFTGM